MHAVSSLAADVIPLSRLAPAADRTLPVTPALAGLFPDAGLRRGSVVGCSGPAATSLALALAAGPAAAGCWVAAVGLPALGVEAAAQLGVPLERLVLVDAGHGPAAWAERLAAAADGFEVLLCAAPPGAERVLRRVRQKLQARGAVLVTVAPPGRVGCDAELATADAEWIGLERGHGALVARCVTITCAGRRVPRPRTVRMWLPGPGGEIRLADP